jgi:hypothetical protein
LLGEKGKGGEGRGEMGEGRWETRFRVWGLGFRVQVYRDSAFGEEVHTVAIVPRLSNVNYKTKNVRGTCNRQNPRLVATSQKSAL